MSIVGPVILGLGGSLPYAVSAPRPLAQRIRHLHTLDAAGGMHYVMDSAITLSGDFEVEGDHAQTDTAGTETIFSGTTNGTDELVLQANGTNLEFFAYVGTTLQTAVTVAIPDNTKIYSYRARYSGTTAYLSVNNGAESSQTWALNGSQDIKYVYSRAGASNYLSGSPFALKIRDAGTLVADYDFNTDLTSTTVPNRAGSNDLTATNMTTADSQVVRYVNGGWENAFWPNLLTWSEELDNAVWAKAAGLAVTPNQAAGPDGVTAMDELVVSAADSTGAIWKSGIPVSPQTTYYFSFYAEEVDIDVPRLAVYDESNAAFIDVNIGYTAGVGAPDRIVHSFTTPAGCTFARVYPIRAPGDTGSIYAGYAQLSKTNSPYKKTEAMPGQRWEYA